MLARSRWGQEDSLVSAGAKARLGPFLCSGLPQGAQGQGWPLAGLRLRGCGQLQAGEGLVSPHPSGSHRILKLCIWDGGPCLTCPSARLRHTAQQETNRTVAASASTVKQVSELLRGCSRVRLAGLLPGMSPGAVEWWGAQPAGGGGG